jgi:hypothetical protein
MTKAMFYFCAGAIGFLIMLLGEVYIAGHAKSFHQKIKIYIDGTPAPQ